MILNKAGFKIYFTYLLFCLTQSINKAKENMEVLQIKLFSASFNEV